MSLFPELPSRTSTSAWRDLRVSLSACAIVCLTVLLSAFPASAQDLTAKYNAAPNNIGGVTFTGLATDGSGNVYASGYFNGTAVTIGSALTALGSRDAVVVK